MCPAEVHPLHIPQHTCMKYICKFNHLFCCLQKKRSITTSSMPIKVLWKRLSGSKQRKKKHSPLKMLQFFLTAFMNKQVFTYFRLSELLVCDEVIKLGLSLWSLPLSWCSERTAPVLSGGAILWSAATFKDAFTFFSFVKNHVFRNILQHTSASMLLSNSCNGCFF